ncbi:MAG: bifunctional tetrahydrofolate synthase/dihydrofolate synthase [Steroidobacteraceae bacterium]
MRFERLADWLAWQEGLHPNPIDLGLERIRLVLQRLGLSAPACPVITIAGTKGKGSCAALLDSMLSAAGYRVGIFTSPHLRRYNERIHIAGVEVSDASLCAAFERIDQARGDISLTYFEFNALAAFLCFETARLDAWVLEVGMGGRLDAVNVLDADVAIVTAIGLDHTEWLGDDLDSIAREKAGIYRAGRPALFGSAEMPMAIRQVVEEVGAQLLRAGQDFGFERRQHGWTWVMGAQRIEALPLPAIAGDVQLANASCAIAALQLLRARLPMTRAALDLGLRQVRLNGRLQRVVDARTGAEWILDVAHNTLSATVLAQHLATLPRCPTLAVMGVMADKDIDGIMQALREQIDEWLVVSLPSPRAVQAEMLAQRLRTSGLKVLATAEKLDAALALADTQCVAGRCKRVLVFGSFLAVGPALDWLGL